MKFGAFIIATALALASCNNDTDQQAETDVAADTAAANEPAPVIISDNTPVNRQVDSLIRFKFDRDSSTLTATGTLHSPKDRIIGFLAADQELDLTAVLEPADKDLNLRFSQIIMPDGKTDGPFGQKITYKLTQTGTYQLVMAPGNMASGKTSGDFTIRLGVSPNPHK